MVNKERVGGFLGVIVPVEILRVVCEFLWI